jgi:hypothetical protein
MDAAACIRMVNVQYYQAMSRAVAAFKADQQLQQLFLLLTLAAQVYLSTGCLLVKAQDPAVVNEVLASWWLLQSL